MSGETPDITERIIGAFYAVYNTLGWGFLEKVYQGAMEIELRKRGLAVIPQAKIEVFYDGISVGDYFADFLVEGAVIVELRRWRISRRNTTLRSSTTCALPRLMSVCS